MPLVVQQRRTNSPLKFVQEWSECAGSYSETPEEAERHGAWWSAYDKHYSCAGWEYRIVQVKKRQQ